MLFAIIHSEGDARASPMEIKKMTFGEKMISKYGATRWEEMKKEADNYKNKIWLLSVGRICLIIH